MPRNGSGSFVAASSSVNPAVASTVIEASTFNTLIDDIETGLSESIARDGQTTATAVIPFAAGIKTDTIVENTSAAGITLDGVLLKDSQVTTDVILEKTAAAGVTADGVLLKDGGATLKDSVTQFQDDSDATKQMRFQLSGITTGNVRTLTVPDASTTLVGTDATQTLTNKTLTSPTIDLSAVTSSGDLAVSNGGTGASTFTDGGVLIGNGTGAVQVTTAGTSGQVLTSNGAGVDPTFQAISTLIIQQVAATPHTANTDVSSVIAFDDTKPTIGEGTEINSLSITLSSASNKVRLIASGFASGNSSVTALVAALHRVGEASDEAIQVTSNTNATTNFPMPWFLDYIDTPGSAGPHTYSIRVGVQGGTARVNGSSSGRYFGGAAACTLVAQEIKV